MYSYTLAFLVTSSKDLFVEKKLFIYLRPRGGSGLFLGGSGQAGIEAIGLRLFSDLKKLPIGSYHAQIWSYGTKSCFAQTDLQPKGWFSAMFYWPWLMAVFKDLSNIEKQTCSLWETLPCSWEVRGHCMCKEMPVILVNKVVVPKRIIGKNGGPRRRRGTRGRWPKKKHIENQMGCK
jgi:hypothetical protein